MKRKSFIIALIVIMVLAFSRWSFADTGDGSNTDIASGECGTCHWVIDGEGTLTVSAGVLDEWEDEPPWFRYSEQIKKVNITDTVVLKTGNRMFDQCWNLTSMDLSGLDTSGVKVFRSMFNRCAKLLSLDLSPLDTSKAEDMLCMFATCGARNLDFSSFDTSHVTNMEGMFINYLGGVLDLTDLDFSSVTNFNGFLSGMINELIIGDWTQYSLRPSFQVGMYDKETGEFYEAGEVVPAVNGHHFVHYKNHSNNYTITNIQLDKAEADWGDWVTLQIDYTGNAEPTSCDVTFWHSIFNRFYSGEVVEQYEGSPFEIVISDNYYKGAEREYYSKFDKATGKGTLSFKIQIRGYALSGTYPGVTISLYASSEDSSVDYAEFFDIIPLTVSSPNHNVVIDEAYYRFDTSFLDALSGLNEGEAAIIRPEYLSKSDVPSEIRQGLGLNGESFYMVPKEYLDAIRGRDIAILVPCGFSSIEINGKDIVNDTKDVYLPTNFSVSASFGGYDNEEMTSYSMSFHFPNNGTLPSKIKARVTYKSVYDSFARVFKENDFRTYLFTEDQIDDIIQNSILYYVSNGALVEDGSIDINGKWIELTVDHNSTFLMTDQNSKKIRSFEASVAKSEFTYNGKVQKPKLAIKVMKGWGSSSDYTTSYSNKNSKSVGTYSLTVKAKKVGYGSQKLKYKIIPKGTSFSGLNGDKRAITVKWKKQSAKMSTSRITGYQIQLATNSKFTKGKKLVTVKGYSKVSKKVIGLKAKKTYYVRIRTYKTVNGTKYYSKWSAKKSVKTKG